MATGPFYALMTSVSRVDIEGVLVGDATAGVGTLCDFNLLISKGKELPLCSSPSLLLISPY